VAFSLAIGRWVEGGGKLVVNDQIGAYSVPRSASELGSVIGDYIVWDAQLVYHIFKTHTSQLKSVDIFSAR